MPLGQIGDYSLKQRGESPQGTLQKEGGVMRTPTKIITALALAGLAIAGGAEVTGAILLDVDYTWGANLDADSTIKTVVLTFDSHTPADSVVSIAVPPSVN